MSVTTISTDRAMRAAAVRHILTTPSIADRTATHLGGAEGPDWPALLRAAEEMSAGQGLLVRVAHDLGEGTSLAAVWELPERLGTTGFARVVEALAMYRGVGAWVASDVPPLAAA
jgi:hypothetical protein